MLTTQNSDPSSPRLRFLLSSSRNWTTPDLRLSLKRRLLRKPSPQHRIIRRLSPGAYSADSPTWDGVGLSPVMTRTIFLRRRQVTPKQFQRDNHMLSLETKSGDLADASCRGGSWRSALGRGAVSRSLPAWPLRDDPFFRTRRWERPGCVPPLVSRGVRAGSSVRAWTRTGRLRRLLASLSALFPSFPNTSPFV